MKILMVADSIVGNGIGSVVQRLYCSLHEKGISCDIVCYQSLEDHVDIVKMFDANGDHIFNIPSISKGVRQYVKNIRKICRDGKYDVIHIHTSLMIFLAAYAAKKEGVKVRIGHAHGSKFFNYPEIVLKILEPAGRILNRKYCTDFVTCSQVSARYTFGVDGKYIPNYVPTKQIMSVDKVRLDELREKYHTEDKIVFGYMGALDGIKNVIFLPEIAYELKRKNMNVLFIIIGKGTMYEEIQKKSLELGCSDIFKMLGHRDNCNELVQIFDYYISTSKSEGMSLSMIEAQMSGKPCFVSSLIPNDSDLGIGLFKKINGFNPQKWAENITKQIDNGVKPIFREDAYNKISQRHLNEEYIIDSLIEIYRQSQ